MNSVLPSSVLLPGCSREPTFDREKAIADVTAQFNGQVNRQQAECYVDRVLEQLGSGVLEPGVRPQPEQVSRLTTIRIDCFGAGTVGTTTMQPPRPWSPSSVASSGLAIVPLPLELLCCDP